MLSANSAASSLPATSAAVFSASSKSSSNSFLPESNFYKNNDTFETKFARHVSVVQRPSSVESRIN